MYFSISLQLLFASDASFNLSSDIRLNNKDTAGQYWLENGNGFAIYLEVLGGKKATSLLYYCPEKCARRPLCY